MSQQESQYLDMNTSTAQIKHQLGSQFRLFADIVLHSLLAELGRIDTPVSRVQRLVRDIYRIMLNHTMNDSFLRHQVSIDTRMKPKNPQGTFVGQVVNRKTSVVLVDVARAGMLPAQTCFEFLSEFLEESGVRQDHIYMNRKTNEQGQVIGVNYSGSKIGGPVKDSIVIIPEPMGATGGSICNTLDIYKQHIQGPAQKYIALHLIITPEYVQYVKQHHPDLIVYAARYDRGLSDPRAFEMPFGARPDLERGLDEHQYIVPGLGGVGEILNNSYV